MEYTTEEVLEILGESVGIHEIVPGYNYTAVTLKCARADVSRVVEELRARKDQIEQTYKACLSSEAADWKLLDFVCVPVRRYVWVPIPWGTRVNIIASVIVDVCDFPDSVRFPSWS
jgi:hypothetical protein